MPYTAAALATATAQHKRCKVGSKVKTPYQQEQMFTFRQAYLNLFVQESLANAKVNARQHCVSLSCLCNSLTQIE